MVADISKHGTGTNANASKTASDGVERAMSANADSNSERALNGVTAAETGSHAALKPSENIKFLEEQLGIDLGGWQSPTATVPSRRDREKQGSAKQNQSFISQPSTQQVSMQYPITDTDVYGDSTNISSSVSNNVISSNSTPNSIANAVEQDKNAAIDNDGTNNSDSGNQQMPSHENNKIKDDKDNHSDNAIVPEEHIRAFQNYGEYAKEIRNAVKNAPHNAKVRMRWIGIITVAVIAVGIGAASVIIPANAESDRRSTVSAIKAYAKNDKMKPSVSGFTKYADDNGIARGTDLEISEWREKTKKLDTSSISVSADGTIQNVSYRLDDATVNAKINVKDNGKKSVKSLSIKLDKNAALSDGVKNGTPVETDGMSMKKANLVKASNGDINLIKGFSFHIPDGFAESYKSDIDDGASTIDRKYAMENNGEISVSTAAADAHPESIQNQRQAEILRNAWNKTVSASASTSGRQADSDTQFAGYTIDFGHGAFGYVSEYATSGQDGTSRKLEARILVTAGDKKATITYTRDGNSDSVPIDEIMKMIRTNGKK